MNGNIWKEVLKQHEMLGIENIIPVSHIRIRPDIGILLDDNGNFVGATIIKNERCSIPCTIDSESRTNGISPHPIHDNMSYICGDYPNYEKRHEAYMKQLQSYTGSVDDNLAKSVYRYLEKKTIRLDIKKLTKQIDNISEEKLMVVFATLSHRDTISKKWTEYYTSTLDKNGICGITGEKDHIPDKYPKGIRNPSDQAKLFIANPKKMDSMPTNVPGYIASQKIIHTLQFMIYEGNSWAYQILKDNIDTIPETWKEWVEEYQAKNGIQKKEGINKVMVKLKKNKTIIIGKSGTGKSNMSLDLALKKRGTTIICNGSVTKSYYEENFPKLKEYENKDSHYNFVPKRSGKYYICTNDCNSGAEFLNALIHGCDYGHFENDKNATFVYDDNAWINAGNNMLTLWQLSHTDCGIIITADSICDILRINENELTEKMIKDISKYWDIVKLVKLKKAGDARCLDQRKTGDI